MKVTLVALSLFIIGLADAAPSQSSASQFMEEFAEDWVSLDPDLAISTRYFEGAKQHALAGQLTPRTAVWRHQRIRLARKALRAARKFDRFNLSTTERLSLDTLQWQLERLIERERYADYAFPLQQHSGANVVLVENLTLRHPLGTPADAQSYLARLAQVSTRMDESLTEARGLAKKGLLPPRFIIEATLSQMSTFSAVPPQDNVLVTSLVERTAGRMPSDELAANATHIVKAQVYPAWKRAIEFLTSQLAKASDAAGLWRFDEGADAYATALRTFTTTEMSAEEIHIIGLREVARIEAEMSEILRALGRSEGSLNERIRQVEDDLRYEEPASEKSREAIMREVEAILADATQRSAALFIQTPRTPLLARAFPRFREPSAAATYTPAPMDGSQPAMCQIPLRPSRMTKFGLKTLVYHEAIPGHHFQVALERERRDLPRFRSAHIFGPISAFNEGWALYAEKLAAEQGWYKDDPEGLLGQLNAELWRARRLVVDTGLHAKRWNRQQAIDYGIEPAEVDRYVANPGQACAYMLGQLKLLELRERMQMQLGPSYSLPDFHTVLLDIGTVPFSLLEAVVDQYAARRRER